MPSKAAAWALNLLLLCSTLLLCVLGAEAILRVSGIQPMNANSKLAKLHTVSDIPGLVYEFLPNLSREPGYGNERVSTNSLGFRGKEPDRSKPLIAMIGDSYTFGFGVGDNETNPHYLAQRFPDYEVINTGVNGYNIEQETLQYEHKVAPLNPSLVILQFVFNDAAPKGRFNEEGFIVTGPPAGTGALKEPDGGKAVIEAPGLVNFPGKYFLHNHSAIFRFVERKTKWLPFRRHASIFGSEWTKEDLVYYERWFDRLTKSIGDRKKMLVIWPEVWMHLDTRFAVEKMARERGWVVLDLYDFYGNKYDSLSWDFHPRASMHAKMATVMADAIDHYKLLHSRP